MIRVFSQLAGLWKQLGINQRISLVLATGVVVAVMAGMVMWSSRPDMQLLYGRLEPDDAGDIVSALEAESVPYELSAGGTSIHVPRKDVYRMRMTLASKGLPSGGSVGFEIFDRGNFGISDFVQRTNYLRAIQGELARTISQISGVRSARVMVVMPENRLLVTDATRRSTASVLVETGGTMLPSEAVNSIRSLVSNAVEGLKIDDVVVVDNRGNVLSEALKEDALGIGMTSGQMRYRQGLEDYFSRKVETMLGAVLGPGNAVVRVSVDVNTSSSTTMEEIFDPDVQVLRSSTVTEDVNTSTEERSGGAVGVSSNTPGSTAESNAQPVANSQQSRKSRKEDFEIGRSTISTVRNAGKIERMTAAVFVAMKTTGEGDARQAQPRSPAEIEDLRLMVVNSLGVVPEKGKTLDQIVSVQEVDFATDDLTVQTAGIEPDVQMNTWIDLGQKVVMVAFGLFAFFYFVRVLKRSQADAVSLELFRSREGGGSGRELESQVTPEMLNELIARKPDNVGQTLKQWMSAEQK